MNGKVQQTGFCKSNIAQIGVSHLHTVSGMQMLDECQVTGIEDCLSWCLARSLWQMAGSPHVRCTRAGNTLEKIPHWLGVPESS